MKKQENITVTKAQKTLVFKTINELTKKSRG